MLHVEKSPYYAISRIIKNQNNPLHIRQTAENINGLIVQKARIKSRNKETFRLTGKSAVDQAYLFFLKKRTIEKMENIGKGMKKYFSLSGKNFERP